jgi:imidazolonepropionase-like amidohydrolase
MSFTLFSPVLPSRIFRLAALAAGAHLASAVDLLPPGHRPIPPGSHALVGGKVVVKPGETLDAGTVVIRDGFIVTVGRDVTPPADARVWDMKGMTIYAGFIDAYLTLGSTNQPVTTTAVEPITAGSGINFFGVPGQERDSGNVGPGYELSRITPEHRAAQTYAGNPATLKILRELGFTSASITPNKGILRGTSAFANLSDANPNEAVLKADVFQHVAFDRDGGKEDEYPGSLMGIIAAVRQSFFDAQHYTKDHAHYRQNPQGRKRLAFNPSLEALVPATEQKISVVFEPGSVLMVDRAARVAREQSLKYLIVASGQEWRRPELAGAAGCPLIVPVNFPSVPKMPEDDDWEAVSLDQFRAWDWAAENPALLRKQGVEIALTTHGLSDKKTFRKNVQLAVDRGLSQIDALAALTTVPARLCGLENQLGSIERGKIANLVIVEGGGYFDADAKVREVWIDGRNFPLEPAIIKSTKEAGAKSAKADAPKDEKGKEAAKKQADQRALQKTRTARAPSESRGVLAAPPAVLVRGASIWTSAAAGRLEKADLLIVGNKIKAVGQNLSLSAEFADAGLTIDGTGLHVTPGLIDCHSHTAILGGVNESMLPSTAMVRISDVVNSETENLYQQLAGGLTTANLLHGSANPIGGQNCVIKLKYGAIPEELKVPDAIAGIKFALGENVKQSNWGDRKTTRFPQSRMGVPTFMQNRFIAAQQYLKEWEDFQKNGGAPPRRDLELEAIGEILQGRRIVHCHSYRQDEILAFLRTMESFGVKVGTLQHVLEGYKVADEIARHGAGASCFSDWWAYKFEVIDAIPYAGSLMRERGAVVSFNSDSSELARRMYLEAAKAVKYGGTSEVEALKFVTLNPAKQLRIDHRVGSLEPGKDADFAIWSKSPLDFGTVCQQTWIEGKKYFDRSQAESRVTALQKERAELLAKAKKVSSIGGGGGSGEAARTEFFRRALEQMHDMLVIDCQDCKLDGRRP